MDILIEHGIIVTNNDSRTIIHDGTVAVKDGRIVYVGTDSGQIAKLSADVRIDGRGKAIIPGLVNSHTHTLEGIVRGLGADMDFLSWLTDLMIPLSQAIRSDDAYVGALLSYVNMIRSGTTGVVDHHYILTDKDSTLRMAEAMRKVGIRGIVARGIRGTRSKRAGDLSMPDGFFEYSTDEEISVTDECIREVNTEDGLVNIWPAPNNVTYVDPELLVRAYELAKKYSLGLHVHAAQTQAEVKIVRKRLRKRPVELLADIGVLFDKFHIVHGVWLNEKEVDAIKRKNACVIHNPVSNMYMSAGVAPLSRLMSKHIPIALGTDGPTCCPPHDMFSVMRTAYLMHKLNQNRRDWICPERVFEIATLGAARVMGRLKELGSIRVGTLADLAIVNLKTPGLFPVHNVITSLVCCGTPSDVDTTIVNGRIIMQNGRIVTVDERNIMERARSMATDLISRAGLEKLMNRTWKKYFS